MKMGYITATDQHLPESNRKRLYIFSSLGVTLAIAAVVLAVLNPVTIISRYKGRISNGSKVHELLKRRLDGVHVETYLFNVTNADRFQAGLDRQLRVQEIGPFTYKETRENRGLELDEEKGTLTYTPVTTVTFLPEESVADPRDVIVTMPNIALLTMASMLSEYSSFTKYPFNLLVRKLKSKAMVTMDAHTYLWGYKEPLISFGNTVMPGWINFDKMGIMDRLYDKKATYRLEVGATDADKFRIHTLNGVKGIDALNYDDPTQRTKCNTFVDAYEGIAYPPGMTPDTPVRIWRNVLCRFLELDFVEQRQMEYGANALVYEISNRTYNYNPDKQCLCDRKEGVCYNGISDLSACFMGLPLAISNAHFLGGEPKLFRRIEGLNPDEKKHGSFFMIEPNTGMVVGTSFTVQVNVVLDDVTFNNEAAPFSDMVLPISWNKIIQPPLRESQLRELRIMCLYAPRIFMAVEILLFLAGIFLVGYSIRRILGNSTLCGDSRAMEFTLNQQEKSDAQFKATEMKSAQQPLMKRVER